MSLLLLLLLPAVFSATCYQQNDTLACNYPNGVCVSIDNCNCRLGYWGARCGHWYCDGLKDNDTENVCSGHGVCYALNNCSCANTHEEQWCQTEINKVSVFFGENWFFFLMLGFILLVALCIIPLICCEKYVAKALGKKDKEPKEGDGESGDGEKVVRPEDTDLDDEPSSEVRIEISAQREEDDGEEEEEEEEEGNQSD